MNKKMIRIIFIILMIILTVTAISTLSSVYAGDLKISGKITPDPTVNGMAGRVFGVAATICYGAAVIIVIIKGVQFMVAAPEGKAKIKEESIAMAIGAGIIFFIGAILSILANVAGDLF